MKIFIISTIIVIIIFTGIRQIYYQNKINEIITYENWLIEGYLHYIRMFKRYKQNQIKEKDLWIAENELRKRIDIFNDKYDCSIDINDFLIEIDINII